MASPAPSNMLLKKNNRFHSTFDFLLCKHEKTQVQTNDYTWVYDSKMNKLHALHGIFIDDSLSLEK